MAPNPNAVYSLARRACELSSRQRFGCCVSSHGRSTGLPPAASSPNRYPGRQGYERAMLTQMPNSNRIGVVLSGVRPEDGAVKRFAARGYYVIAADVGDGTDLERGLLSVQIAMNTVRAQPEVSVVAVVGYGTGGRYAYLAITRLDADAGAVLHGSRIGEHLDEAKFATKPLTIHFGDSDAWVSSAEVARIKGALEGFVTTEIYRYPGVGAGFAIEDSEGYDAEAAAVAESRVFLILEALRAP
jgi:hypothetical protein